MENKLHNNCTIKQNPDIYRRHFPPLCVENKLAVRIQSCKEMQSKRRKELFTEFISLGQREEEMETSS